MSPCDIKERPEREWGIADLDPGSPGMTGMSNSQDDSKDVAGRFRLPAHVNAHGFFPAMDVLEPATVLTPLVFSSPHSGANYPADFIAASPLDSLTLRRSEDAFVDELFSGAIDAGAPMLRAHFPRAFLDVNREPYELDPRMFEGRLPLGANTRSIRVAGGLGTIARVVGDSQEIYRNRLPISEAIRRIDQLYRPYHDILRQLVDRSWRQFGVSILIDCHSMPSSSVSPPSQRNDEAPKSDFIIGDRYGTSCNPVFTAWLDEALHRKGFAVRRNKPYAGGYITESYGSPAMGVHAIQIEVNRGLYMNEATLEPHEGFEPLRAVITDVLGGFALFAASHNDLLGSAAAE